MHLRTGLWVLVILMLGLASACQKKGSDDTQQNDQAKLIFPGEKHFRHVKQLTFEGQNWAEGYFSFKEDKIIFQATRDTFKCDQIFIMDVDGKNKHLVSTGKGRTTCSYFLPGDDRILYSSTHHYDPNCPPPPDYSKGYVWALYPTYDIFVANADGSNLQQLTDTPGYDAETTVSPDGKKMVFTSTRNGDIDIFVMDIDGKNVKQLTHELGYDGGPFFSRDCKKIVYRAYHPKTPEEIKDYKELLKQNLIRPTRLELWVMDADGSNKRQITHNGAANFAPFFHPDGKRIIFSSNLGSEDKRNFDLWMINVDGTGLERITYFDSFDGFPMFSHDGKKLIFASNRNAKFPRQTNLFLADWQE